MRSPETANTAPALNGSAVQRVGGLTHLPALVRQLGADPAALLHGVGLASDALDLPDGRIPFTALSRLLQDGALRTKCSHFGLLVGRMWHLGDIGLVGELVRHSPSVGEALHTLTVYQRLNSEGALPFVIERGGMVDFGWAIYQPGVPGADQYHDAVLAVMFNVMRELCGSGWVPTEAFLPHARPPDVAPFRSFFKVTPKFNAEIGVLRFPVDWLSMPVEGADPARRRQAQADADELGRGHLLEQVRRALRILLLRGMASGNEVAQMLSMHRRTLNRRLQAEGTTFQHVLDAVRFEVARQLLATDISLDDIAAALGYAGVSPFMRAFRRWAGTSPGQWRHAAGRRRSPEGTPDVGSGSQGRSSTGSASRRGK